MTTVYMSTVYKLAFASSALLSRMIGSLIRCNGLHEINNLSNEQYSLNLRKGMNQQVFQISPFCLAMLKVHVPSN